MKTFYKCKYCCDFVLGWNKLSWNSSKVWDMIYEKWRKFESHCTWLKEIFEKPKMEEVVIRRNESRGSYKEIVI